MKAATSTASASLLNLDLSDGTRVVTDSSSSITATGFTSPTIYIDGSSASAKIADTNWHFVVVTTATGLNADDFSVASTTSSIKPFGGAMDDVRLYNRAISADEIKRLYALGNTTHISTTLDTKPNLDFGLVGHWTFDGKDMYTNVKDTSGQGNNGDLILGASGNTSTTTAPGKLGQALTFDGTDDYIGGGGGAATVAFDAVGPAGGGGASGTSYLSPLTWSHTVTGSNTALFVSITLNKSPLPTVTGMTYNGSSLQNIDKKTTGTLGSTGSTELWYMAGPTSDGSPHTVSVAFSGGPADAIEAGSVSFTNVDQTTPYQNATYARNEAGPVALTVMSAIGDMALHFRPARMHAFCSDENAALAQ